MRRKNGFTLIELLAVIIILGVLLLVAIPTMNGFIENAKKDTFLSTAKQYITAVRYMALQGEVTLPRPNRYTAVATKNIELDQGSKKSAFNKAMDDQFTYVLIANTGTVEKAKYAYYYTGIDSGNNGMGLKEESAMQRSDVKIGTAGGPTGDYVILSLDGLTRVDSGTPTLFPGIPGLKLYREEVILP